MKITDKLMTKCQMSALLSRTGPMTIITKSITGSIMYLLVLSSCNIQSVIPTTVFFQLREMLRIMKMPAQ